MRLKRRRDDRRLQFLRTGDRRRRSLRGVAFRVQGASNACKAEIPRQIVQAGAVAQELVHLVGTVVDQFSRLASQQPCPQSLLGLSNPV